MRSDMNASSLHSGSGGRELLRGRGGGGGELRTRWEYACCTAEQDSTGHGWSQSTSAPRSLPGQRAGRGRSGLLLH